MSFQSKSTNLKKKITKWFEKKSEREKERERVCMCMCVRMRERGTCGGL